MHMVPLGPRYFCYITVGTVKNKRSGFSNRRLNSGIPRVPLKDRSGTTIKECRRETQERRIDNIQAAWININS